MFLADALSRSPHLHLGVSYVSLSTSAIRSVLKAMLKSLTKVPERTLKAAADGNMSPTSRPYCHCQSPFGPIKFSTVK